MDSNVKNFIELRNVIVEPVNVTMSNVVPSDEIADIVEQNWVNLQKAYFAIMKVNIEPTVLKTMIIKSEEDPSLDSIDTILDELEDVLQELRGFVEEAASEIELENNKVNNLKQDEYGK